jgi:DnaK suppressor protein
MSAIDTDKFKQRLLDERERVQRAIAYLHEENPGTITDETGEETTFDNHLADTATVTHDREVDYTLEENSGQVLAEIDRALARIEDGTYGRCRECGKEIPVERLEVYPWASLCIDDARKAERA